MKVKLQIAHQVPGRIRMKIPSAKGNPAMLEEIQKTFSAIPGIEQVVINPETGSVVLRYDADQHDDFHAGFTHRFNEHHAGHARGAVLLQVAATFLADAIELFGPLRLDSRLAGLFEIGEGRIDHARARNVVAAGPLFQHLDQIVAMARLFGDQGQQEQLQVVGGELASGAEAGAFKSGIGMLGQELRLFLDLAGQRVDLVARRPMMRGGLASAAGVLPRKVSHGRHGCTPTSR
jgi:hypothetical protein